MNKGPTSLELTASNSYECLKNLKKEQMQQPYKTLYIGSIVNIHEPGLQKMAYQKKTNQDSVT